MKKQIKEEKPKTNPIESRAITHEMQESYLDYAMSVIVSRALPDVRDGLKPVHRRILYSMWNMGLRSGARFRKSATVVGEVLGKYHPHGDMAVYDAMVRLAQDFSLRYPLISGQGNFGSIDGDAAAAHRYTEVKLSPLAEECLFDIEKDTVPLVPNYDGTHKEPKCLPAKLPNLLLNGSMGIAVGMATNIPPHNLREVVDGIIYLIDHPNATIDKLAEIIKGPDFPTGGIIFNKKEIKNAYEVGRGGIVIQAKTDIVEQGGTAQIIITEIPYQVNKAALLEKIASLINEKRIEGIKDMRDETTKEGVRIVVELKRGAYPKKVLNRLFVLTPLRGTFHFNVLALIEGIQPRNINLKEFLEEYIKHRQNVTRRRASFDLSKAKDRAHVLEGLRIAIFNIDKVIATIKKSRDREEAGANLIKKFKLTEPQSLAILEMRLQQLASLERLRIEQELKEKKALVKELSALLASPKKILASIKQEITELKEKYGDERRTQIIEYEVKEFKPEDFVPNEPAIIMVTKDGYIKRLPPESFKRQGRGGKGVSGLTISEEDMVERLIATTTYADLLFFTTRGRVFRLKAYEIPKTSRSTKGQALANFLEIAPNEQISALMPLDELEGYKYFVMTTKNGLIKKTDIQEFKNIRHTGLIAIKLKANDRLGWVKPSTKDDQIILVTSEGQAIRFNGDGIRATGRAAGGMRGIRLKKEDEVVGMDVVTPALVNKKNLELFVITKNGYGKKTDLSLYKAQGRGGFGIKTGRLTDKTGKIVAAYVANKQDERDLIVMSLRGQVIRLNSASIPSLGRATQGIRLMKFKMSGDRVSSVAFV